MNVDGILVLDKPVDKSSAFITRIAGKIIGAKKVGHLGTLDPFATGVLPIAVNNATKVIQYIKPISKTYAFDVVFGVKTNTGDRTGVTISTTESIPCLASLKSVLPAFVGDEVQQLPHPFSAVSVNGQRAYRVARSGKIPEIKSRRVSIFSLDVVKQISENTFSMLARVGPGTYIRSIAEDIAAKLNTFAYVNSLRRTVDGKFKIMDAITIDSLEKNRHNVGNILCRHEDVLDDIPVIFDCSSHEIEALRNGLPVPYDGVFCDGSVVAVCGASGFFAIVESKGASLFPRRIVVK